MADTVCSSNHLEDITDLQQIPLKQNQPSFVTRGLDPRVQSHPTGPSLALDGRVKPGHDDESDLNQTEIASTPETSRGRASTR
jgi:hypothetical protein